MVKKRAKKKVMIGVKEIRNIVEEHLSITEGLVSDIRITACFYDEGTQLWKVNVSYLRSGDFFPRYAASEVEM